MILLRLCYGLCSRYDACLDANPFLTKAVTTAIMGLMGDVAAQVHEGQCRARLAAAAEGEGAAETTGATSSHGLSSGLSGGDKNNPEGLAESKSIAAPSKGFRYDRRRGIANAANSFFLTAPVYHYGYDWLEGLIPTSAESSSAILGKSAAAFIHVLVDCIFFDALFVILWVFSAYAIYRLIGGKTGSKSSGSGSSNAVPLPSELASRRPYSIKANLVPAILAAWKMDLFVIPIEYVLFRYFPLRLRVFGMNLIDLVWDAVVSFTIHDEGGAYAAASGHRGSSWDQEEDSQITTASESTPDTHGLWWGCRSWSRLSFGDANRDNTNPQPLDGADSSKQKRS